MKEFVGEFVAIALEMMPEATVSIQKNPSGLTLCIQEEEGCMRSQVGSAVMFDPRRSARQMCQRLDYERVFRTRFRTLKNMTTRTDEEETEYIHLSLWLQTLLPGESELRKL